MITITTAHTFHFGAGCGMLLTLYNNDMALLQISGSSPSEPILVSRTGSEAGKG